MSPETRFIPTPLGGYPEILIPVNGVPTWRAARWVDEVAYQLCDRRGIHTERAPVLRPVLEEGEELVESIDGRLLDIVRVKP